MTTLQQQQTKHVINFLFMKRKQPLDCHALSIKTTTFLNGKRARLPLISNHRRGMASEPVQSDRQSVVNMKSNSNIHQVLAPSVLFSTRLASPSSNNQLNSTEKQGARTNVILTYYSYSSVDFENSLDCQGGSFFNYFFIFIFGFCIQ